MGTTEDRRLEVARPAPRRPMVRIAHSMYRQRRRSLRSDEVVDLSGQLALVTGGNRGIGEALTRRLRGAGAEVVVAARGVATELAPPTSLHLDLGDLEAVTAGADALAAGLAGRPLDLVVLNAGLIPTPGATSAQGHEQAYGVNVLGHHVLLERLRRAGALRTGARVVAVTGDLMVLARSCTPDFVASGRRAGGTAYARSKLGVLWAAQELAARRAELEVVVVHPGVVASGLGQTGGRSTRPGLGRIDAERSAEAVLLATTRPFASGAYLHNTLGLLDLEGTTAGDGERRARFVAQLDELAAPWLAADSG